MKRNERFRVFLLLWLGRLINAIGSGISSFSLSVYIYSRTGLATDSALILLVTFLPDLLLSVPAGVLADRFGRRKLMILGDSLSAISLFVLLLFINKGKIEVPLILICLAISSVFTSLIDPSYKATVSEILDEKDYTKANGFVQFASSSKFLISPIIAGFIMKYSGVEKALILDILTVIPTIIFVLLVEKKIKSLAASKDKQKGLKDLKVFKEIYEALEKLKENRGLVSICMISFFITFSLGGLQTLLTPIVLSFTTSDVLGLITSISACGMLVSSLILGFIPIKSHFREILSLALLFSGLNMIFLGLMKNQHMITVFGFLFFFSLPFANVCMDFLVRRNIDKEYEGRIWALVGFISQLGYVFAYALIGVIADKVFSPLLLEGGVLSESLGPLFGIGQGRGMGLFLSILGALVILYSLMIRRSQNIKKLEGES